jgi:hypothetical protein
MEQVLELSPLPYDPKIPLVWMDEHPVQRLTETRQPLPAAPGKPEKVDSEYERHGTANIFLCTEPLKGTRQVRGRAQRTAVDWAPEGREVLEGVSPDAERGRVVCDHLNTPRLGALYEAFPPETARALGKRLELYHPPKHGSWRNIAEIALSVLSSQCLDRRSPDIETLGQETCAWEMRRNACHKGVDWQLTTQNARRKLKHLYPQIQE